MIAQYNDQPELPASQVKKLNLGDLMVSLWGLVIQPRAGLGGCQAVHGTAPDSIARTC